MFKSTKSIRISLIAGFLVLVFLIVLITIFMRQYQRDSAIGFESYIKTSDVVVLAQKIEGNLLRLQRYVLVFRLTSNPRVKNRIDSLNDDLQKNLIVLDRSIENPVHKEYLKRMSRHFIDYTENYSDAANQQLNTSKLINSAMLTPINELEKLFRLSRNSIEPNQAETDLIIEISRFFSSARLSVAHFARIPDANPADKAELMLNNAIEIATSAEAKQINQARFDAIAQNILMYKQLFSKIRQQTRSYLYLTNVVMAGSANEYLNLSRELQNSLDAELEQVRRGTESRLEHAIYIGLVMSVVSVLIALFLALIMTRGISRLALAEIRLQENSERYKSTVDQAKVGIAEIGADGVWIRANREISDMLGYSEEELLKSNFRQLTYADDVEEGLSKFDQVLAGEIDHYAMDKRYIKRDGTVFWVNLVVSANRDDNGELRSFICVIEDIDDKKTQQQLLEKSHSVLEEMVEERVDDLKRSNAELQQFAYVASHDLQEPLRMIISYMQLVERRYKDKLDAEGKEFIDFAVDGAHRMQKLIQSLLEYSRVGTREETLSLISIESIINNVRQNLALSIEQENAEISAEGLPEIFGSETQLMQLFQNLISNSIRYRSDAPPKISITARQQGSRWLFSLSDNGIGFEMQFAERIFIIFQRLHGKEKFKGTGIGLAICKKIVERHGGKIWVESEPDHGTTFFFTLPGTDEST